MNDVTLIIALAIGFFAVVFIVTAWITRARANTFRTLAAQLGLTYRDNHAAPFGFAGHGLARLAMAGLARTQDQQCLAGTALGSHLGHCFNMVEGQRQGRNVKLFDFYYRSGKSQISQTVAVVELPAPLPLTFWLEPEGLVNKLATAFGGQDIDFQRYPKFSSLFRLRSEQPAETQAFFDQRLATFFESNPGFTYYCLGDRIVTYRWGRTLPSPKIRQLLESAEKLADLIQSESEFH